MCYGWVVSYMHDGVALHGLWRRLSDPVYVRLCRVEVLIQCDAGTYQLQTGQGNFSTQDPGCGSSHCDLVMQPVLATIEVVSPPLADMHLSETVCLFIYASEHVSVCLLAHVCVCARAVGFSVT